MRRFLSKNPLHFPQIVYTASTVCQNTGRVQYPETLSGGRGIKAGWSAIGKILGSGDAGRSSSFLTCNWRSGRGVHRHRTGHRLHLGDLPPKPPVTTAAFCSFFTGASCVCRWLNSPATGSPNKTYGNSPCGDRRDRRGRFPPPAGCGDCCSFISGISGSPWVFRPWCNKAYQGKLIPP